MNENKELCPHHLETERKKIQQLEGFLKKTTYNNKTKQNKQGTMKSIIINKTELADLKIWLLLFTRCNHCL